MVARTGLIVAFIRTLPVLFNLSLILRGNSQSISILLRSLIVCGRIFYEFPNHFSSRKIFSGWRYVFVMQILKKVYKTFSTLSSISSFSLYSAVMVVHSVLSPLLLWTSQFCVWPWNCSNGCIRINIEYMFTARKSVLLNSTAWTHYYYYYYYYCCCWLDHNNTYSIYYSSYQGKSITEKLLVAQLVYGNRNFIRVIKS